MTFFEILTLAMTLASKLLDKMPDYTQSKKEKFYELKRKYELELVKDYPNRDDNLIDNLRDELQQFLSNFSAEITGPKI